MKNTKFYICEVCGNLVTKIEDSKVPMICCGKKMAELAPNTVEASGEKHLPVYVLNNNVLEVSVGSVIHPMSEAHHIRWIYVETEHGGQIKYLDFNSEPKAVFSIISDRPIAVFEYCNLHGLWKSEVK